MKKVVQNLVVFTMLLSTSLGAQNSIQLNIHHKLGEADFALETSAKNNLDHDFEFSRLQYYISEITIVHDGGMETPFNFTWVLVNATEPTQVDLGDENINVVERLKFHIGVDKNHNHLDPAGYQASHPLAPQFPSMHWGWASGYRFIALEGNGGPSLNQLFELHGLDDANYFETSVPLTVEASNGEVIINLDADYTRALENIQVNTGVIVHGDDAEAKQCLENFRDYVFSPASGTTSTIDFSEVSNFEVFPNPANGNATLTLEASQDLNYQVSVTDILGKQVLFFNEVKSNATIDFNIDHAGVYFINLIKAGQPVITRKLISK